MHKMQDLVDKIWWDNQASLWYSAKAITKPSSQGIAIKADIVAFPESTVQAKVLDFSNFAEERNSFLIISFTWRPIWRTML